MITEDYCSYEVSKLLKEKGFVEPCTELNKLCLRDGEKPVLKVTHQKAMRWLREKKKLFINVWYDGIDFNAECVVDIGDFTYIGNYTTYEQAIEGALKYSLKKLI